MSLFAIADTHLSFGTDKPMNIFRGWQDFEARLEKNWRNIVTDDDTVVIAGDISWAMSLPESKNDFEFLNSLPGEKLILKGNHDYWWNTRRKIESFWEENGFKTLRLVHNNAYKVGDFCVCGTRGWFYDAETDVDKKVLLREAGRLRTSIQEAKKLGGEPIVFLHYPPVSQNAECSELLSVLEEEKICRCYYGHLHGAGKYRAFIGDRNGVNFSLISGDFLEFCPKIIEKI